MRGIDPDFKLSQIGTELLYQIHFEKKNSFSLQINKTKSTNTCLACLVLLEIESALYKEINMKFHLQSCRVSPKSDTSCFIERSASIMQLQQGTLMLQNSWAFGHWCMTVAWQTADGCHPFATKISRDVISAFSILKCRSKKPLFSAASKCFSYRLGTILAKLSKEIYLRFFELPYFSNRFSFSSVT